MRPCNDYWIYEAVFGLTNGHFLNAKFSPNLIWIEYAVDLLNVV